MRESNTTTIRTDTSVRHAGKYGNKNPIHQLILGRFLDSIATEIDGFSADSILDFGCGEAFFWKEMEIRDVRPNNLTGIDLRTDALATAQASFPQHRFIEQDILSWTTSSKFDLVVASQVLEHLPKPEIFLRKLVNLSSSHLLLSVPWEPYFKLCNLARGRDILRLGNHPEHINGWGAKSFRDFVDSEVEIVKYITVFPFLLVLAKPKQKFTSL